ncbi:MAG: signal recognition particle-docking protein FtsY [Candidatus Aenigmarchaeota archaeon]|nr:signal recognition particle-docking protein FtsY [Candidatus Aenigmarchaeota archaeon]
MFKILKEKLSKLTKSLAEKLEKPKIVEREEVVEREIKEEGIVKKVAKKVVKKIVERKLSEEDLESILREVEVDLIDADVAYDVVKKIKSDLKASLVGKEVKRGKEREVVISSLKKTLLDILAVPEIDLEEIIEKAKEAKGYATFIFFGINGVGKSLNLTKVGYYLKNKGYRVLLAAGDTFRPCGIEQLEKYAEKIGVPIIKGRRGEDACSIIFDSRKSAEARGYDVILADTSGRMHVEKGLMDELAKIVRVNKPDLKILVLDGISGSDVVPQFEFFNKTVGIDAILFSKMDINEKGGNVFSVCYLFKKPILFLGVGQDYTDLVEYKPEKFVNSLLE